MNNRLQEIIAYKTGGKKNAFAELMGWTPPYLTKLLNGDNFGLKPVMSILEALPEINARWFLFGVGDMLEAGKLFDLQRETMARIQELLDLDKYMPYMSPDEIHQFEEALTTGKKPVFSPGTITKWQERLNERQRFINAKFADANNKSNELCRQRTAKK